MRRRWQVLALLGALAATATVAAGSIGAGAQVYPPGGCSLTVSASVVNAGSTVEVSTTGSDGFAAGATVTLTNQATGEVLATVTADAGGQFSVPIVIPPDSPAGSLVIVASGRGADGSTATCSAEVSVVVVGGATGSPGAAVGGSAGRTGSGTGASGGGGALAFTGGNVGWLLLLALLLLTLGTALVLGARRRAQLRTRVTS